MELLLITAYLSFGLGLGVATVYFNDRVECRAPLDWINCVSGCWLLAFIWLPALIFMLIFAAVWTLVDLWKNPPHITNGGTNE